MESIESLVEGKAIVRNMEKRPLRQFPHINDVPSPFKYLFGDFGNQTRESQARSLTGL